MTRKIRGAIGVALLAALMVGACGGGAVVSDVAARAVATEIADRVEAETNSRPIVTCPEPLRGQRGAKIVCLMEAGSPPVTFEVFVTVKSVDGEHGTVVFDFAVDREPLEQATPSP